MLRKKLITIILSKANNFLTNTRKISFALLWNCNVYFGQKKRRVYTPSSPFMRFDALFARRDEVFASQLIKKRRYCDWGNGGAGLRGVSRWWSWGSNSEGAFLVYRGCNALCAMKASNVFGSVRREHNDALTVDSWWTWNYPWILQTIPCFTTLHRGMTS